MLNLFNASQVSCPSNSWFNHPKKILEKSQSCEAALNVLKFSVIGVSNLFLVKGHNHYCRLVCGTYM